MAKNYKNKEELDFKNKYCDKCDFCIGDTSYLTFCEYNIFNDSKNTYQNIIKLSRRISKSKYLTIDHINLFKKYFCTYCYSSKVCTNDYIERCLENLSNLSFRFNTKHDDNKHDDNKVDLEVKIKKPSCIVITRIKGVYANHPNKPANIKKYTDGT